MIAFHVPGRSNGLRSTPAAERFVNSVRYTTERAMNDGIKLPDLTGKALNRSLPFAEIIDITGVINHLDGHECAVADCCNHAERCMNPLNPLDGSHCSEHANAPIPKEHVTCGLISDPEITDTPLFVSKRDRKRRCVTRFKTRKSQRHEGHWHAWDTAEGVARFLYPQFREYFVENMKDLRPNERLCTLCLRIFTGEAKSPTTRCRRCVDITRLYNHPELREWSLSHLQPQGGRDKWFRETSKYLREGVNFIPFSVRGRGSLGGFDSDPVYLLT